MNYSTNYNLRLPDGTDDVDVSDISYDMEQIDEIMKANADGVSNLQSALDEDETDIGNLKSRATALESSVDDLESEVDHHSSVITALDNQINRSPGGLDDEVADLKTDVSSLKTRMTTAEGSLTSLQSTVSGLSTDLDSLESTVAGHTTDITGIGGAIDRIDGNIVTINGKLTTDEATIASHTSDISDLKDADDAIDGRLDALEGAKKYQHFVCLAGSAISVMFSFISDSSTALSLNDLLGIIEDYTQCNGMYNGWAFNAIKLQATDRVVMESPDPTEYQGRKFVAWAGVGIPAFTTATTLSIKEI